MSLELCINKRRLVLSLFYIMLFVNTFFSLFPAWRKSPLWSYFSNVDDYFTKWMQLLLMLNLCISCIIIFIDKRWYCKRLSFPLFVLWFMFLLSIVCNGLKSGILALVAIPITYYVLFVLLDKYVFDRKYIYFMLFVLALWTILPILLIVIGDSETRIALFTSVKDTLSTFGGFALHRNFYGFYAGAAILFFLLSPIRIIIKICASFFICIGILLSASRSSLLIVFISVLYYIMVTNHTKKAFFNILLVGSIFVLFVYVAFLFDFRGSSALEDDGRTSLALGFWNIIKEDFFWGKGCSVLFYSTEYPIGSPAHNIILQVWADYGLFVLIAFLFFLFWVFRCANMYKRVFLLYLYLFSLFQPYFTLGMPNSFLCMSLLFSAVLNSNNSEKNCCIKS